ncbi:MAG: Hpt domain-containing protein [Natronospirillum sp.]|uniref:Hpt domain-containing protein n=1 Tax=Natronospirillum sp. TaxID=2812955 RepID=UPI0025E04747|nr:Hpt domain-containing protein [Natronospirillum sp.]MCH8551279.1 Hpt domain-containing protein [Natronospirillum sp.]
MSDSSLDLETLAELRLVMEDEFDTLMTTFLEDSQRRIEAIREAQTDLDDLRRAAHAFKGSSSNVGARGLANCCQALESLCREANDQRHVPGSEEVEALILAIERELELTRAQLEEQLAP